MLLHPELGEVIDVVGQGRDGGGVALDRSEGELLLLVGRRTGGEAQDQEREGDELPVICH